MKRGISGPNTAEARRIDQMLRRVGCICCRIQFGDDVCEPAEVHHILMGSHAMGALYTLPLCPGHHRGYWSSKEKREAAGGYAISDGRKLFNRAFGSERELWERTNRILGIEADWPDEKVK